MDQTNPVRTKALVVENDHSQRQLLAVLFEESEFDVIECDNAELAVKILETEGASLAMLFTDVELGGEMDGIDLAYVARKRCPDLHIIVTSGAPRLRRLPDGTQFMAKPWRALDILREAERSLH
jgi:DNA-binding NtrC family response regulator